MSARCADGTCGAARSRRSLNGFHVKGELGDLPMLEDDYNVAPRTPQPIASKQPYFFDLFGGGLFAFAGLWDAWRNREGYWLQSFAIVTTAANELMAPIHSRMPVILHARDYDRWLDRGKTERPPIDLLRP